MVFASRSFVSKAQVEGMVAGRAFREGKDAMVADHQRQWAGDLNSYVRSMIVERGILEEQLDLQEQVKKHLDAYGEAGPKWKEARLKYAQDLYPDLKKIETRFVNDMKSEEVKGGGPLTAFGTALDDYSGMEHNKRDNLGHRDRRDAVVDAYKQLPDYMREFLTAPSDTIDRLYRGADKAATAGKAGTANVSFSLAFDQAAGFGASAEKKVYDRRDIASFDGIINLQKAIDCLPVVASLNKLKDFTPERSASGLDSQVPEWDFMVHGIKWKGGVT
jgi:hypothetical protein